MSEAHAPKRQDRDLEDEFANASDGEEYESMELPTSVTSIQQQNLAHFLDHSQSLGEASSNASPTPLEASESKGASRPKNTTNRKGLTMRNDSPPSSFSSSVPTSNQRTSKLLNTSQPSRAHERSDKILPTMNRPHQPFNHTPPGSLDSSQPLSNEYDNLNRSFNNSTEELTFSTKPEISSAGYQNSNGSLNAKEAGHSWGSFSSWINTAVSTVSEVIENPNVVVSKAHTIGQGIRNVATEQIDRVYESLDPEYDYARERQNKQEAQIYYARQERLGNNKSLKQASDLDPDGIQSRTYSNSSVQVQQMAPGSRSNTLESSVHRDGKQDTRDVAGENASQSKMLLAGNNLAFKEDNDGRNEDSWGDDAWGDDWYEHGDANLIEKKSPPLILNQGREPVEGSSRRISDIMPPSHQEFSSVPQAQTHDNQGQSPTADTTNQPPDNERIVKNLFSQELANKTSVSRLGLTVPPAQGDGDQLGRTTPRRSSADMRPADALFSTLDFASNALGSAVLGVHRKVTQASQPQPPKNTFSGDSTQPRPLSPAWSSLHQSKESQGTSEISAKSDRMTSVNPSLEVVGGNVVSTGLGALEILGKKAVDVISDVRRAGQLSHGQGIPGNLSDQLDDSDPFKVPAKMNVVTLFDEAGGRAHLNSMRSTASVASSRVAGLVSNRLKLLQMGQIDDLEELLGPHSLDSATEELSTDLLAGHKDFRSIINLLDKMGVQGTGHLRQLRICTKKLASLVPDNVNAFEQEWHNHQSRASERDFFAKAPIKKFFESRLLSVYFDGLRSLSQFTIRACHQLLKIADSFDIRLAEKVCGSECSVASAIAESGEQEKLPPLVIAKILKQFIGSLIAETKFIARTYSLTLDSVLEAARRFTTPLDRLDWEDLAFGLEKIKGLLTEMEVMEAVGLIHTGASCIVEVLKNELIVDAVHGKLVPETPRARISQPKTSNTPFHAHSPALTHTPKASQNNTARMTSPLASQPTSSLSLPAEQKSELHSPLLAPRTASPLINNASLIGQPGTPKGLIPTTPVGNNTLTAQGSKDQPVRRPSSGSSSLNSVRSTRALRTQPKLSDEDFFSILNNASG
ncbi:hypothetical protein BGX21_001340 [Mortierella sp. AD011]|nr:hypothetical protein BGX20_005863 [Mortierella sp. AD010]KAF9401550.1 hypothetical protein BGX21_001340 [Mortierella sp. AD011]